MKTPQKPLTAFLAVSSLLSASLFQSIAMAASSSDALPNLSSITNHPASSSAAATASNTGASQSNSGSQSGQSTSQSIPSITGSAHSASSQSVPVISNTGTATGSRQTGLPSLPSLPQLPGNSYSYPPASVPPTQNAPYMQTSSYPEGTVFIAVGGVLGFLALAVLLYRGLIAWALHRSVKRAAQGQDGADTKALFRTPAAPMYKYSDRDSTLSLSNVGSKGGKKARPLTTHAAPDPQSLFFSPTAGVAGATNAGKGMNTSNRASSYLPAGYYAAGAAAQPGAGLGAHHAASRSTEAISLSSLRPHSQGYSRTMNMGPSPPDSPTFHAQGYGLNQSTSSVDVTRLPGGRAPSAYLDDLFGGAGDGPSLGGHI